MSPAIKYRYSFNIFVLFISTSAGEFTNPCRFNPALIINGRHFALRIRISLFDLIYFHYSLLLYFLRISANSLPEALTLYEFAAASSGRTGLKIYSAAASGSDFIWQTYYFPWRLPIVQLVILRYSAILPSLPSEYYFEAGFQTCHFRDF